MNKRGVDYEITKASFNHDMIYLNEKKNSFLLKANIRRPLNHWLGKNMKKASQLERVDPADNDYRFTGSNSVLPVQSKQLPTVGKRGQPVHTVTSPLPGWSSRLLAPHSLLSLRTKEWLCCYGWNLKVRAIYHRTKSQGHFCLQYLPHLSSLLFMPVLMKSGHWLRRE